MRKTTPDKKYDSKAEERCSFCKRGKGDFNKLIIGPGVSICDRCVLLCDSMLYCDGSDKDSIHEALTEEDGFMQAIDQNIQNYIRKLSNFKDLDLYDVTTIALNLMRFKKWKLILS
jgi:hypothetical protein